MREMWRVMNSLVTLTVYRPWDEACDWIIS